MAVIEEVTAAYEKERVNPDFLDTLDKLADATTPAGRRRCTRPAGSASTPARHASSSSEKT